MNIAQLLLSGSSIQARAAITFGILRAIVWIYHLIIAITIRMIMEIVVMMVVVIVVVTISNNNHHNNHHHHNHNNNNINNSIIIRIMIIIIVIISSVLAIISSILKKNISVLSRGPWSEQRYGRFCRMVGIMIAITMYSRLKSSQLSQHHKPSCLGNPHLPLLKCENQAIQQ